MDNKIYLNDQGSLVIDYEGVSKTHRPTGIAYGIYDSNAGTFSISHDIQKPIIATGFQDEAGTPYASLAELKGAIDDFFARPAVQHVGLKLTAPAQTTLTNAGEWYPIQGVFAISQTPKGFKIIEGVLTFVGLDYSSANFNGTSDLKSDTNTKVYYGLFRNEEVEPASISEHDFTAANKVDPMVIADVVELMKGDELFLRAKSDAIGTKIDPQTLSTTLFCDR